MSVDNFVKTKNSKKGMHVYFNINIHRTSDRDKEIQVTEASLRLFKNRKYIRELRRTEDSVRLKIYQLIRRTSKDFKDNRSKMKRNISVNANNRTHLVDAKTNAFVDSSRNSNGANRRKQRRSGRRLIHSRLLSFASSSSSSSSSFEDFDVLKSARDWIADASSNHGFLITMESADHHRLRDVIRLQQQQQQPAYRKRRKSGTGSSKKNKNKKRLPQLNIFVREEEVRSSRAKRSATDESGDCRLGDGENRCCRFSTWISFADIGWSDWIIAPAGFLAHFCDGTCPPHYRPANRFASVKELVRAAAALRPAASSSAAAASPPPTCCSATRMSALPIAHYNHDGVAVISIFEDLVVEECRCA